MGPDGRARQRAGAGRDDAAMGEFFDAWPQMRDYIEIRAALRRIGDSEADIGHAINFLIGDDSAFITGQTLVVNGGALML